MQNWTPCELEAFAQSKALDENAIYIRESEHPVICLTDNIAVVEASKKIKRGLYSASPRLQTLITATQRYNAEFRHISGKLPTDLINVADFASRNPVECKEENCKVCHMSREPDMSFCTIRSLEISQLPISSRKAWKEIQESCEDLRLAAGHLAAGTKIKNTKRGKRDSRLIINKGVISKDGLLVINETLPMEIKPVELIVVPRDYSVSIVTLLHNDSTNNHPSIHQMNEILKRRFFIFNRERIVREVHNNCLKCTANKKIKMEITSLENQTKPDSPGTRCNADVLIRNKQKILVLRDNLTSFTLTKIIQSEQKEDLKTGLISLLYTIKPNQLTVIRVDPHSSFVSLKEDAVLLEYGIQLEIGHEKNINKNGVAEKSIQELEAELVKISPGDQPVTEIELIKATHLLNNRIRHTHRSAKELLLKRNQDTGESLKFNDKEIAQSQEERREKDNALKTEKETKANIVTEYELGDLVFVISDKKNTPKETLM